MAKQKNIETAEVKQTEEATTPPEVDVSALVEKIEALEKKDAENQAKLKMLYDVADKGRVFNYENQQAGAGKKVKKIKLSVFDGSIIVGWRTLKDELIKHPTSGMTVGEKQEYELLLFGKDSNITKVVVEGYPRFSEIRYTERIEADIIGQTETFDGVITFDVALPDGRTVKMDSKFIN